MAASSQIGNIDQEFFPDSIDYIKLCSPVSQNPINLKINLFPKKMWKNVKQKSNPKKDKSKCKKKPKKSKKSKKMQKKQKKHKKTENNWKTEKKELD